jgi:hypothetical protein
LLKRLLNLLLQIRLLLMPLSDKQLVERLEDLAFKFETLDDYVYSKILLESAARILQLSGLKQSLHPTAAFTYANESETNVRYIVQKNLGG